MRTHAETVLKHAFAQVEFTSGNTDSWMPPPKPDKLMLHLCLLAFPTIFLAIPLAALKMLMFHQLEVSQLSEELCSASSPEQG